MGGGLTIHTVNTVKHDVMVCLSFIRRQSVKNLNPAVRSTSMHDRPCQPGWVGVQQREGGMGRGYAAGIVLVLFIGLIAGSPPLRRGTNATTAIGPQSSHSSGHQRHVSIYDEATISALEARSETFYNRQKLERRQDVGPDIAKLVSRYPCIRGMVPVGTFNDGHKWVCGLHAIRGAPIVFSFGSFGQQDFELDLLTLRPDARVFVFEIMPDRIPKARDPRISYHAIGLGSYPGTDKLINKDNQVKGSVMRTLTELMQSCNVSHIDVLKMDIEGFEFQWLKHEGRSTVPLIGQLLVEVHMKRSKSFFRPTIKEDAVWFVEQLEGLGLRLFSSEPNADKPWSAVEFGLVQAAWGKWDRDKTARKSRRAVAS